MDEWRLDLSRPKTHKSLLGFDLDGDLLGKEVKAGMGLESAMGGSRNETGVGRRKEMGTAVEVEIELKLEIGTGHGGAHL